MTSSSNRLNPDQLSPRDPAAVEKLRSRGVIMPNPAQVFIGGEVPHDAISPGAVLHPFCRITGETTRIGAGAVIGLAGAATLHDSRLGVGCVVGELGAVTLKGVTCGPGTVLGCGVAEDSVFLGKESAADSLATGSFTTGYGFRVRRGSLYEEDASSAQAVIGLAGAATLHDSRLGVGCVVGELGAVTLKGVTCGPGTVLGCGVAEDSVFLGKESAADSLATGSFTTGYGFRDATIRRRCSSAERCPTMPSLLARCCIPFAASPERPRALARGR